MRRAALRHQALATLLLAGTVAACGGQGPVGGPTPAGLDSSAPSSASTAPVTSPGTAAIAGGLDIAALLGGAPSPPAATSWTRISDPGAAFTFEVPSSWTGHAAYPWQEGDAIVGTVLAAGPDPSRIGSDFSVPGVAVGLSGNPAGLTARASVEADDAYAACTPSAVQEVTEGALTAALRTWEGCDGGSGFLVVMAIAQGPGGGLIAIAFQGTKPAELGYLVHIVGSIAAAAPAATARPAATGPGPGATAGAGQAGAYSITLELCRNQHGQGVAEGLIRNDDALVHSFRIVVAFSDPNDVFLNDTAWTTSDLQPGVTARWQAMVPSGLPAVSVTCRLTSVEVVR